MRTIFIVALWAMLIISVTLVAQQNPPPGPGQSKGAEHKQEPAVEVEVSGEVVDRDGKAIEKAKVDFTADGKAPAHAISGGKGMFTLKVPPGEYTVTAHSAEAQSKPVVIQVAAPGPKKISIELQ